MTKNRIGVEQIYDRLRERQQMESNTKANSNLGDHVAHVGASGPVWWVECLSMDCKFVDYGKTGGMAAATKSFNKFHREIEDE